jgi:hypothetical protein
MIRLILIILCLQTLSQNCWSQEEKGKLIPGAYFSLLIDPVILATTLDSANVSQYFINTNLRYAFNKKFMAGTELILAFASPEDVNDPFYLVGLTFDYNFLRVEKSKLNIRVGVSFGNLSYADDFEPQRRMVINRVIGGSYEFRINKTIWIYAGYYNHLPLNKIPYKYATAQPFIGACFELN